MYETMLDDPCFHNSEYLPGETGPCKMTEANFLQRVQKIMMVFSSCDAMGLVVLNRQNLK